MRTYSPTLAKLVGACLAPRPQLLLPEAAVMSKKFQARISAVISSIVTVTCTCAHAGVADMAFILSIWSASFQSSHDRLYITGMPCQA